MKTRNNPNKSVRQAHRPEQVEKGQRSQETGLNSLRDLLIDEMQDLYDAEKQLVQALPKVAAAATCQELKKAIEGHLEETRGHVQRLERAFQELDEPVRGQHCDAMEGLLKEGKKMMEKEGNDDVVDAGIIAAAQRVEHYEIAGYGTVCAFAKRLGYDEIEGLLSETLSEEKKADEKLTEVTESALDFSDEEGETQQTRRDSTRPDDAE